MPVQYSNDYIAPKDSEVNGLEMKYNISDFVGVFENAFPHEFCAELIDSMDKAISMGLYQTRQTEPQVLKVDKQDEQIYHEQYVNSMLFGKAHSYFMKIMEEAILPTYRGFYDVMMAATPSHLHSVKLQRTEKGGGYHLWHYEQDGRECADRQMTFILYLNDIEDGGETEFLYQNRRIKPKAGTLVLWPASYTHTHRGNPPLSNTKYIMTGWYSFLTRIMTTGS